MLSKNAMISDIEDELAKSGKAVIRGFGTFELIQRQEHKARNPSTGEEITVPAHKRVKFKTSGALKAKFR